VVTSKFEHISEQVIDKHRPEMFALYRLAVDILYYSCDENVKLALN